MVTGIDKFKEAFAQYADNYVIIGGTACDIVLQGTDMRPRATSVRNSETVGQHLREAFQHIGAESGFDVNDEQQCQTFIN